MPHTSQRNTSCARGVGVGGHQRHPFRASDANASSRVAWRWRSIRNQRQSTAVAVDAQPFDILGTDSLVRPLDPWIARTCRRVGVSRTLDTSFAQPHPAWLYGKARTGRHNTSTSERLMDAAFQARRARPETLLRQWPHAPHPRPPDTSSVGQRWERQRTSRERPNAKPPHPDAIVEAPPLRALGAPRMHPRAYCEPIFRNRCVKSSSELVTVPEPCAVSLKYFHPAQ